MKLSVGQKNWLVVLVIALAVASVALAIPYLVAEHQPSLKHLSNLDVIWPVVKYLLSFFGVWMTYFIVKNLVHVSKVQEDRLSELWRYLGCVGVCGFIATLSAFELGTHREDVDPMFGDGETVVDYIPTDDARIREGLILFLCLCAPALCGIHDGLNELHRAREETFEEHQQRISAEALAQARHEISLTKRRRPDN